MLLGDSVEEAAVRDVGVEPGNGLGKVPAEGRRGEELEAGGLHLLAHGLVQRAQSLAPL